MHSRFGLECTSHSITILGLLIATACYVLRVTEHEGCLKCRVFHAGHRLDKCSISLSGKDYNPRILYEALCAKGQKTTSKSLSVTVTVITESSLEHLSFTDLVVALPSSREMLDNNNLSGNSKRSFDICRCHANLKRETLSLGTARSHDQPINFQ